MDIRINHRQGGFTLDVAFRGAPSGVTALYGPSGAGKTSVVNMVAGLLKPDAGRIAVNGLCLFDSARHIDLPPEKRRIGYVFQDGRLLPHLSVRSNLTYGMHRTPARRRFVKFDPVVELLGIGRLLDRRPSKLSGGEKQRVAIGRALLTSPALLLMDEPLAALDPARKAEVLPFVMRLGREFAIPILYVSHALDEILHLAVRMVLIQEGRVLAEDDPEVLLSRSDLQSHLGRSETESVISAVVDEPEDAFGLTRLRFGGHTLKVQQFQAARGESVRVRIPARQVAVALSPPRRTSFQNVFPGEIREIWDHGAPFVDVRLDIGRPLWARITRQSLSELNLKPGRPVFALIKSVAVSPGPSDASREKEPSLVVVDA
ncbi:molybdenum ABC transporter ATP-binding protein [Desulfococcus multivorans]|uniref:Molybdate ABC transporter, ATPase subunit n=1 Tax=Desulfococcus multivorans DSM 2059 TaxID=1121405 RepID=S7TT53_DESML|nr:molybdenum ABC transporter ATP-binding protein [Desulfococcus multivorans]AOY57162.1 ModC: molybdate ABC transporter, ATP-binding protein [Desulfococcus multivorans]AQU99651.1 molybdenum ABC transporter ATP-binding protein [Desulfococcus multivorans]EPR39915.1 molybdate ABC transporter, ATPase subunit [Desulfococcus multivorans DSM 2059]SKA23040.1 molybdate transport system ATP-binding protein [Desulfococcus multivorans DSM 2059]